MAFCDVQNQKRAVELLQRSLRQNRLAHAYLFIGARGADREALARTLAKTLNCEGRRSKSESIPDDSCDKCPACKKTDGDAHPDVHWVRPESKSRRILTEKIRELEQAVYLKPRDGRVKIGIIVDADRMVASAANAFLKTLEEPPRNSVLLLLTSDVQRLLPTIVSRCLPVRLAAVAADELSDVQTRVVAMLAKGTTDAPSPIEAKYQTLANLNALLQSLRQKAESEVAAAWDEAQWGSYDKEIREKLEDELAAAVEAEYLASREEMLGALLAWHRDVLVAREGGRKELLAFPTHADAIKRHAATLNYAQAAANVDTVEKIRQHLEQNIGESLALEVGLLQLK